MNLKLILLAALPAFIIGGASSSSPSFYRPTQTVQVFSKNELFVNKGTPFAPTTSADACDDRIALSLRGGEGNTNVDVPNANELAGAAFFTALQVLLNKVFVSNGIKFPAMLGCTISVFTVLVLAEILSPGLGERGFELLTPGTNILSKWLPVMFVPGLAMLPLAPSIGSPVDALKVLSMIVLGFGFTMASTGYLVLAMRTAQGLVEEKVAEPAAAPARGRKSTAVAAPAAPKKPFTDESFEFLLKGTVVTGAISVAATRQSSKYATPLRTIFMFFGTVLTYIFGARLPSGFTKVVHPLVTSTAGTLLLTKLDSLLTGSSFEDVLRTYKAGSLSPSKTGAGDLLLFLLGPAVGCLAVPMYGRKKIMADNLLVIVLAMLCSSVGGLFGTAWYVRLLNISSKTMIRLSLLSRNVTTGLAIVITQILEGNIAIAASVVVLTGIFGATVGRGLLDILGIEDPVSRGLGMGAAGQGLGVAAMMPEKEAFPLAAINMVLTGLCATALVSIPSVKETLVSIVSAGME
jgi:putative effector of murein hydrolase